MTIFDDTLEALEVEARAADTVDKLYVQAKEQFGQIEDKYEELRGIAGGKFGPAKITEFVKNNKGGITAVLAAFGIPTVLADDGAFDTILGLGGKLFSLFGIG